MLKGGVEARIRSELEGKKTLIFVLVDSEVSGADAAADLAARAEKRGASAVLVGGSTVTDQAETAGAVRSIRGAVGIPTILFPGNVAGVVPGADAILFTSLMNSEHPHFITQAQALGAPSVLRYGLEALPTAYLVIGEGTTAWFVGSARGIPRDKPKIAAAYSLAARFLGMRFVYLEAGSGAAASVRPEMVAAVRAAFDGVLIVGGGIRDAATAGRLSKAGADVVVVGTMLEAGRGGMARLSAMARAVGGAR